MVKRQELQKMHKYWIELVDLYAMRFNPVLPARDYPCWIDENIPLNTLKNMILESSGGFIQRFLDIQLVEDMDQDYKDQGCIDLLVKLRRPKSVE